MGFNLSELSLGHLCSCQVGDGRCKSRVPGRGLAADLSLEVVS